MKKSKLVTIYFKYTCPYSVRALNLLESKEGIQLKKIDISGNEELRREMIELTGRHTVPEIFIEKEFIGGCDDLLLLESNGILDKKLYE